MGRRARRFLVAQEAQRSGEERTHHQLFALEQHELRRIDVVGAIWLINRKVFFLLCQMRQVSEMSG